MTDSDPLRRYVEAGLALTQLTRAKAEALVRDWVKAGDLQREQAQDRVEELLDRSRKGTDSLVAMIRREMAQQLSSMGFATKKDLAAMEARLMSRPAGAVGGPAGKGKGKGKAGTGSPGAAPKTTRAAPAGKAGTGSPGAAPKATKTAPTGKAGTGSPGAAQKATRTAPAGKAGTEAATPPVGTAARKAAATRPSRRGPRPGAPDES
ncbi:MAG: hypothetical protein ACT4PX_03475 [Actinomycetota bacterium]